jgi:5,10-methylenetetrahydrofolate reductase
VSTGPRRRLKEILDRGEFAVTVEYNPPKGTNVQPILDNAKLLLGRVSGVNVTDNTAAIMRASSLSLCKLLHDMGHDPVMQMTCRDRNRIGMQSDLLGAHLLGIRNILCLTGDYPTVGDHKDAKPVYDLDSVQIMQLVKGFNEGRDLAGNKLDGVTEYMIGAAVTPEMDPQGPMLAKFEAKVKAGASFFQTQAIYDAAHFAAFMKQIRPFKAKVLAGILLLRSAKMAEFLNANIPGISVPAETIAELRAAGPKHEQEVGIDIAVRTIKAVRSHCDGVHLMVLKATDKLPDLLTKARLG